MSNFAKKTGNKGKSLKVMKGGMTPDAIEAEKRRTPQAQIKMLREAPKKYNSNGKHIEIIYKRKGQVDIRPSGIYKVDTGIKELHYREKRQKIWDIVGTISELSNGIIITIKKPHGSTIEEPHGSINPGRYLFSYYNDRGLYEKNFVVSNFYYL